jgi:hypothetical protein
LVYENENFGKQGNVNLIGLTPGIYILVYSQGEKGSIKKIIKE